MHVYGVRHLLTHNTRDFARFSHLIEQRLALQGQALGQGGVAEPRQAAPGALQVPRWVEFVPEPPQDRHRQDPAIQAAGVVAQGVRLRWRAIPCGAMLWTENER